MPVRWVFDTEPEPDDPVLVPKDPGLTAPQDRRPLAKAQPWLTG
jgi:hypothetical protein